MTNGFLGRHSTFLLAALGAALYWLSLPPLNAWPLAWLAATPWIFLIDKPAIQGRRPYWTLAAVGFAFWLATLYWLSLPFWALWFGWIAMAGYLGIYLPLFVAISRVAVHRLRVPVWVGAPIVWVGLELARAHMLTGFTMGQLSHSQYRQIPLIQIADLGGAFALDFVMLFFAAGVARLVPMAHRPRSFVPMASAVGLLAAVLGYGFLRMSQREETPGANVAIIQGSIDLKVKDDPNRVGDIMRQYFDLSLRAVREYPKIDLLVWPETMFRSTLFVYDSDAAAPADYPGSDEEYRSLLAACAAKTTRELASRAERLNVPLLLGIDTYRVTRERSYCYNSALLTDRSGKPLDRYDKQHPVMFGEYIPFSEYFPWIHDYLPVALVLDAGQEAKSLPAGACRFSPSICFESVLSHRIRDLVNQAEPKPNALVNLTNDGWFEGSSELDLHLACGVFRAVECRMPLVIAANTGFSAHVDAEGRIHCQGPRRNTGTLLAEVKVDARTSPYLRYGDWSAGLCLIATVLVAICPIFLKRRGPSAEQNRN